MELLSAKELLKYPKIKEKIMYICARDVPISHAKIGRKIDLAKELIDKWIPENIEREKLTLVARSGGPLLKLVTNFFKRGNKGVTCHARAESINGLKLIQAHGANMSFLHILGKENTYL